MAYKIKSGDTLGALAKKYNTSVGALAKANKISNPNRIRAGAKLTIPGKAKPKAKKKAAPKKKKQSAAAKWLAGDSTYQQQLSSFNKSQKDYETQYKRQRGITTRDYDETQRGMNRQASTDRSDQKEDFAGRGILRSGVYAKALGDYNTDFQSKMKNLLTGKNDAIGDLAMQRTNFLRQLSLEKGASKQDALRRRAQKLGI